MVLRAQKYKRNKYKLFEKKKKKKKKASWLLSNSLYAYDTYIAYDIICIKITFRVLVHSKQSNLPLMCTQIIGAADFVSYQLVLSCEFFNNLTIADH